MNKFWLFFGIFLSFTGFGTIPGILLVVIFVWSDLKKGNKNQNSSDDEIQFTSKYYNEDTLNEMK
ncbi:MAG: hypothetical protein HOD60_06640 [Candidatus Nitrosopelagicus sp.]|nr:hypothetical protein [Candidatus Nitrosopelagicus sp.]